jgi:hypothetical protein
MIMEVFAILLAIKPTQLAILVHIQGQASLILFDIRMRGDREIKWQESVGLNPENQIRLTFRLVLTFLLVTEMYGAGY